MSKVAILGIWFAMMLLTASVQAAGPAGEACAANLTADGKAIYAAIMAAKPTAQTLRDAVEHQARGLAMEGKIARSHARENAVAAGECAKVALE